MATILRILNCKRDQRAHHFKGTLIILSNLVIFFGVKINEKHLHGSPLDIKIDRFCGFPQKKCPTNIFQLVGFIWSTRYVYYRFVEIKEGVIRNRDFSEHLDSQNIFNILNHFEKHYDIDSIFADLITTNLFI